jgi:serine/threonine protein kinase
VKFYLASVILALSHLHKHDVAYRNLKPENILIDDKGHIKLTGFSLAKTLPYADEQGVLQNKTFTVCGTVEYMAPEMVVVMGHGTAVDAWALGVLACELLTGLTPFGGVGETMKLIHGKRRFVKAEAGDAKVRGYPYPASTKMHHHLHAPFRPPFRPTSRLTAPVPLGLQVLAAIAETMTKGVRLPPAAATELILVPGGVELVMGLLDPSPSARMTVPVSLSRSQPHAPGAKSSSSQLLLKLQIFAGFDWNALKNQNIRPVFIPPKSDLRVHSIRHVGDTEDEKFVNLLRRRPYEKSESHDVEMERTNAREGAVAGYLESTTASRLAKTDKVNDSVLTRKRDEEDEEEMRQRRLEDQRQYGDLLFRGGPEAAAIFSEF